MTFSLLNYSLLHREENKVIQSKCKPFIFLSKIVPFAVVVYKFKTK